MFNQLSFHAKHDYLGTFYIALTRSAFYYKVDTGTLQCVYLITGLTCFWFLHILRMVL